MQKLLNIAKLAAVKAGNEIIKFYAHKGFDDEILAARSTLSESVCKKTAGISR